jgi:hypothetical protein
MPHGWVIARELAEKTKARRRLHCTSSKQRRGDMPAYTPGSERKTYGESEELSRNQFPTSSRFSRQRAGWLFYSQ